MLEHFKGLKPEHRVILARLPDQTNEVQWQFSLDSLEEVITQPELEPNFSKFDLEVMKVDVNKCKFSLHLKRAITAYQLGQYEQARDAALHGENIKNKNEQRKCHKLLAYSNKRLGCDYMALNYFNLLMITEETPHLFEEYCKECKELREKIAKKEELEKSLEENHSNEVCIEYVEDGEEDRLIMLEADHLTWSKVRMELIDQLGLSPSCKTYDLYVDRAMEGFQKVGNMSDTLTRHAYRVVLSPVQPIIRK